MNLSDNKQIIQKLFNKMQKTVFNFEFPDLIFPHEYIAFETYKIHMETLLINLENKGNVIGKLTLAFFRRCFENDEDFNQYDTKKADYIDLVINKVNAKDQENKEEAENEIESEIITILFNIKKIEDKNSMTSLITTMKKKLKINCELYYLLLIYLDNFGYDLHILIDYLPQILKEKYPDSTFDFSDVLKTDMKFGEFIQLFISVIDREKNYDYADFKFNKETKTILISHKSIDEIKDIIVLSSNYEKKEPKEKSRKGKKSDIGSKTLEENENIKQQNVENNKEEESGEKRGVNIQISNIKEKNTGNIDIKTNSKSKVCKEDSDEGNKNIRERLEKLEQIIKENDEKYNDKLEENNEKIEKLMNDNKKLMNDNKKFKNENKSLNKKIQDINSTLSNKIMENKKKISLLEFDLKLIGLRDAYKSFIDLLIFIMNLDVQGNLKTKIKSITNVLNNCQNKNVNKIIQLLNDSSNLLTQVNNKAHYINVKEGMIKQLIFNLSRFSGNKEYIDLIDILNKMNVEDELVKLVKNRSDKFIKSKEDFIKNQETIKEIIQKNPLIANGNGFATLMNC